MILNPATIALVADGILVCGFAAYASATGYQIVRRWDLKSGSDCQASMERKTYLVSAIMVCVLGFEIFSLFLFVYTAEHIHTLFVGAVCAAGSLNAGDYGYPTLAVKAFGVAACGAWFVVDHADNQAPDYPLIKTKYKFLIGIAAFILVENLLQIGYFGNLRSNMVASFRATLFAEDTQSPGGLDGMPAICSMAAYLISAALVFGSGFYFAKTGRGAGLFSVFSTWFFVFSTAAAVSFVSVYNYELPTRNCPFDLLQKEYYYIGYPLYVSLLAAGALGLGTGIVKWSGKGLSVEKAAMDSLKRICAVAMVSYAIFIASSLFPILLSELRRLEY